MVDLLCCFVSLWREGDKSIVTLGASNCGNGALQRDRRIAGVANDGLNIQRQHEGETAALRQFDPAYDRFGSFSSDGQAPAAHGMSASLQKRTQERLPCYVRFVPIAS